MDCAENVLEKYYRVLQIVCKTIVMNNVMYVVGIHFKR